VLPCNRVRPSADTPCSRSLPIRGRAGVSLSTLCSGLLPSGGAAQTNMVPACPCTDQYWLALRVRAGASCVCRLRCPSASPPGHVSQGASRIVGLGDWLLDLSVEPCQTFPVCVGPFGNGFHDAVRSSPSGPHCFQGLLSFAPKRLAHKGDQEVGGLLGSFSLMARSHARPSLPGCGRDGPAQRSSGRGGAAGGPRSRR